MILYAGSYTQEVGAGLSGIGDGIYCFNFNEDSGELNLIHTLKNQNTSYLTISENKKFLYSFQEVSLDKKPVVLAYAIEDDFSLELINQQPIDGGLPCHLSLIKNGSFIAVACYETGSVHLFPIMENGSLGNCAQDIRHKGKSVNAERQESAHAHMVSIFNNEVFVPDLGIDAVVNYQFVESENQLAEKYKIKAPLGSGPRHMVFHPNGTFAFVMNELTATVSLLKLRNTRFEILETINSLSENYKGVPSGAAIKISNCGKFLYCSNRGSETITIFQFNEKEKEFIVIGYQEVFGKTPRDFSISPNGKWLLVGNQDSNEIVVFKIDDKTGLLEKVTTNKQAHSIVCLKWL